MAGANIQYSNSPQLWQQILTKLGHKANGPPGSRKLCMKDGAPADDTAADAPEAAGDFCWDYTNNEVYFCSAFTDSDNFTWTKVT